jgi:Helix-turn-helix domain
MSIQAVAWALGRQIKLPARAGKPPAYDPLAKLVLVSLANHACHKTGRAFPPLSTLCEETSLSRRCVQEKLQLLELRKLIRIVPDHDPKTGRQRANSYFLRLGDDAAESLDPEPFEEGEGAPDAPSLFDGEGGCAPAHGEGAPACTGEGAPACTPIETVSKEPSEKPSDPPPNPSPRGGAKIVYDPLKTGALLETACAAIAGEGGDDVGAIGERLKAAGFSIELVAPVPDRGDGRGGRIPIVARRGTLTIAAAVGIDEISTKDLAKLTSGIVGLAAGGVGRRVGIVRKGNPTVCPAGLDALVVLEAPKPPPRSIWIEADTVAWVKACEATGHKRDLHAPARDFGGRRGWVFSGDKLAKLPADVIAVGRAIS